MEVAVATMGTVGIRRRTVVLAIAIQELAKVLRHEAVATTVYKIMGERLCKGLLLLNLQLHTLLWDSKTFLYSNLNIDNLNIPPQVPK